MIQITKDEAKRLRGLCKKIHIRNAKNKCYLDGSSKALYFLQLIRCTPCQKINNKGDHFIEHT